MIVYISSPYSQGDKQHNVDRQINVAHFIMDLGHTPMVPLLSHYMHLSRERSYEDWMRCDLDLVPRCDILLRLDGDSEGADREVLFALENHVTVVFSILELYKLLVSIQPNI